MKFLTVVLGFLAAWVSQKTRRDYETGGRLSTEASAFGWILYIAHLFATLEAALRPERPLPLPEKPSVVPSGSLALFGFGFRVVRHHRPAPDRPSCLPHSCPR